MNFYSALLDTFLRNPSRAIEALYWQITGRKVRARNRLRAAASAAPNAYRAWIIHHEVMERTLREAPAIIASWKQPPRLSVLLYRHPDEPVSRLQKRIAALEAQIYGDWELVFTRSSKTPNIQPPAVPRFTLAPGLADDPCTALYLGIQTATSEYILPLGPEATLSPDALFRFAQSLQSAPDTTVIYGDEDTLGADSHRHTPWFKPQWNPELFLAQDYLSGACLIRRQDALAQILHHSERSLHAILLTITSQPTAKVMHTPHVLAHHLATPTTALGGDVDILADRILEVTKYVAPLGATAQAGPFGTVSVEWPLPDPPHPLVTVIIPTRDHADLLRKSVTGVLHDTAYHNVEIIIVDNGSNEPETLEYLGHVITNPRVTILRDDGPFNFSRLNNMAARVASGAYLCLLNNDVEIIDKLWLSAMMRQAIRPGIGAVGAKLLYDDHSIQHAGVTIGLGEAAGHAHRFQKNDQPGYFARAHAPHHVSAVTAACLVVETAKYREVGGLDEEGFAVAFNDVDFCLKLQAAGYHNLYEPRAILIHHESKSRGKDFRPENIQRYMRELALLQKRWGTATYRDPLHHPALDSGSETYRVTV